MLQRVRLANFKCFENLELDCAPLTLLCGLNGAGKSSVIQALLVLWQSVNATARSSPVAPVLNGDFVRLGTGADVLFDGARNGIVRIEVQDSEVSEPYVLEFDCLTDSDSPVSASGNGTGTGGGRDESGLSPFTCRDLLHVGAERTGSGALRSGSRAAARYDDAGLPGGLASIRPASPEGDVLAADDPRCDGRAVRELSAVLDHWSGTIGPGARRQPDAAGKARASFVDVPNAGPADFPTRMSRAVDAGFGLSSALPVVVSLLNPPNTLCLIEHPEAHLHPKGQTRLADLAVRASKAGLQVIVETHSDHFLDGVRIAVREDLISPEDVAIHHFEREGSEAAVSSPRLDGDGRLSSWPPGFFDQHEENLARLLTPAQRHA